MISIQEVHSKILKILKKNYGSFVTPSGIDEAVNSASVDLFNQECIRYRESQTLPDILKEFKKRETYAAVGGIVTTAALDAEIISMLSVVGAKTYPIRIVQSEREWISRSMADLELDQKTGEPLNFYIKELAVAANNQEIPQDFIAGCYAYLKEISTGKKYDILLKDSKDFDSRNMSQLVEDPNMPEEPFQLNKQEHIITTGIATIKDSGSSLPANFIKALDVEVDGYKAILVNEDMFNSKHIEDVVGPEGTKTALHLNRVSESFAANLVSAGVELSSYFVKANSVSVTFENGDSYEGELVDPEEFYTKQLEDLIGEKNQGEDISHLFKTPKEYLVTAASERFLELPGDYVRSVNFFYKDAQNNFKEGEILTDHEFSERIESKLMAPTVNDPIARIINNKIEFYPKPTGVTTYTYVLTYMAFPVIYRPLFKIEDNKLFCRPALPSTATVIISEIQHPVAKRAVAKIINDKLYVNYGDDTDPTSIKLTYLAHPVEKRPVLRIKDNQIEVDPINITDFTYVLGHYIHPVEQRALARVFQDDTATKIELAPASVTSVIVNSLEKPNKAIFGFTQANGVITYNDATSTDLNWDYKAVTSIIDRALFYLGHPMRDPMTISLERTKEEADKSQKTQQ